MVGAVSGVTTRLKRLNPEMLSVQSQARSGGITSH